MHIGFLHPQGNFDPEDSYWTEHPDFGGQLVYAKQVALAMAERGHRVDILTRQIIDPQWPEFAEPFDSYPDVPNVRIIRLPAGPGDFLPKESLWRHLVQDWVPNILEFYQNDGGLPNAMTTHYGDGGLSGTLIEAATGVPFTFTAHSLGAQKMDKLEVTPENLAEMDENYKFSRRLVAERLSMNRSALNITSTQQERFEQYNHPAYRGAVDVENDARFAVIPPGVDPALFDANTCIEEEESIYQLVKERLARDIAEQRRELPAIIAASRLEPKKNHLGLVQAFAQSQVLQERANLVLVTSGLENPLQAAASDEQTEQNVLAPIREVIKENNLGGKVSAFALPNQPALAAAYRFLAKRRSVFALTAHYEPFGLAPLEAAVAGLPVIATQNGGPSESLQKGNEQYGILVDPSDPTSIAQGLERVIGDVQVWEQFSQRGHQHVLAHYTWESIAENYLALIEQIVPAPAARRPQHLLPIHSYFHDPRPETDISLEELSHLYFSS